MPDTLRLCYAQVIDRVCCFGFGLVQMMSCGFVNWDVRIGRKEEVIPRL